MFTLLAMLLILDCEIADDAMLDIPFPLRDKVLLLHQAAAKLEDKMLRVVISYRKRVKPRVIKNYGVRLLMDESIHPELIRCMHNNKYETDEIAVIRNTIKKGDVVLDLGAGVGFSAIFAAKLTGAKVYAVEANKALIPIIEENAALNHVNIEVIHGAIGRGPGFADFYISDAFWASSLKDNGSRRVVRVPIVDFQNLVGSTRPTYVNMDIEGTEGDVLPFLLKRDVPRVSVEVHDNGQLDNLVKVMGKNGYQLSPCGVANILHFC
jgi:FkbM family methyltransferase